MLFLFSLFLSFGSSIRIIVDKTNFNSLVDISFKLPVFIVFYSPYCIHCTKMHPDWLQFMEQYKDDKYIVAAEINCVEFRKEASQLMTIRGYPTYAIVRDGQGTSVSVTRTTKDFCAKAEEIKSKYPPKVNPNIKCSFFTTNNDDKKYPFMTLLASYTLQQSNNNNNNNVIKRIEDACKFLEEISKNTNLDLEHFFINQTTITLNSTEYLSKSNSFVVAKVFLNPIKAIEYKLELNQQNNTINQNNSIQSNNQIVLSNNNIVTQDLIYNIDLLSNFAREYLIYKPFGEWDIINDAFAQYFAFKQSTRRLLLFVFESKTNNDQIRSNQGDDSEISDKIILKYKAILTNNAEHFITNSVPARELRSKWKVNIPHYQSNKSRNSHQIDLIVSNLNKSSFALIKDIESSNINDIITKINSGFYDDRNDKELEPLKNFINKNEISIISKKTEKKKKKSPFAFFAISYFICALIITVITVIVLTRGSDNTTIDSKNLIEHETESENDNAKDYIDVLTVEPDENEQLNQNDDN